MNTGKTKTEELLQKGKGISLSAAERADMKTALSSYARYHGVKQMPTVHHRLWFHRSWVRGVSAAALSLVLLVGTSVASLPSLPGEFLYPVKTGLVEALVAATKISPQAQLEYQHKLFETRLAELHQLSEAAPLTPVELSVSQAALLEIVTEVDALLAGEDEISDDYVLEMVGDMIAVSSAAHEVVRSSSTEEQTDQFDDLDAQLRQMHREEMADLLDNGATAVEVFIEVQLNEITTELAEQDLSASTTVLVGEYIEDAQAALVDDDLVSAVVLTTEALQHIKVSEYSTDFADETAE